MENKIEVDESLEDEIDNDLPEWCRILKQLKKVAVKLDEEENKVKSKEN